MKGLGHALEAMVASITLVVFTLGALQVTGPDQDWAEYQRDLAAQDLSYSMQETGHTSSFLGRGETGSIQTAMTSISERDMEVSGLVSGLPVNEISIGSYAREEERFELDISSPPDECSDQLGELVEQSEHADESELYVIDEYPDDYDTKLYFADVDPTGLDKDGYDSVWVDNGTQCQFAAEDGPHHLGDVFYWGDEDKAVLPEFESDWFELKDISVDEGGDEGIVELYNATETREIIEPMNTGPNEIQTDISKQMVDSSELEIAEDDITLIRGFEAFQDIDNNLLEQQIEEGSIALMANPEESSFTGSFLEDLGFEWMGTGFREGSGDKTEGAFSDETDSRQIQTYFEGLGGENPELNPPGEIVSNRSEDLRPSRLVYSTELSYDVTKWNRELDENDFEERVPGEVDGDPDSACYEDYSGNERPLTLAEDVEFEGAGEVDILSAKLGADEGRCDDDDFFERGVKIDRGDGFEESDLYLNGEFVEIGGRLYVVRTVVDLEENENCEKHGDCARFISAIEGNRDQAELLAYRNRFPEIDGGDVAVTGYPDELSPAQINALNALMFWMGEDDSGFEGREEPGSIETLALGSIDGESYIPYELRLRWSD